MSEDCKALKAKIVKRTQNIVDIIRQSFRTTRTKSQLAKLAKIDLNDEDPTLHVAGIYRFLY